MPRERARTSLAHPALLAVALLAAAPAAGTAEEVVVDVKNPVVRVRAELDLFVNDAPGGTSLVVLEGGDALVLPSDLERAGLVVRGGTVVTVDDRQLVSLRSLGPALQFTVDERGLALRITAPPDLLGRPVLDLRPKGRPSELELRYDRSAFLDYAIDSDLAGHNGLTFEAGGRVGRWLAQTDLSRTMIEGSWVRGMSSATRDDVQRLERWTVGDTLVSSGTLGGSVLLGGVAFGRELSLDPYRVNAPLPATTAIITAPSTLEVYVNGAMVRQQALAPGYWDLANLPAVAGQTQVRAVVRDAFGRERVLDSRFYFAPGLLTPGFADYGVATGFRREAFGLESFDYGGLAATARYRVGVSDWFTPGVRAEAAGDVVSAGGSAAFGTRFGEIDLDASGSGAHGDAGAAAQVAWSWLAAGYSGALRVAAQSARYATVSLDPALDRPLLDADAIAGMTVSRRVGLAVELRAGRYRDLGPFATAGLNGSVQVGAGASLTLSADYGRAVGGPLGVQLLALLTWGFKGHSADVGVTRDRDGHTTGTASVTKPLPRDDGVGYFARATGDERAGELDGGLQGQTSYGRAELDVSRSGGATTYHANASGGLVFMGNHVYASRPTQGGFAVVDVGVSGVGVTIENSPVGRTGADGTLLVTDLQPYYASKLAIRDRDLPLEYESGKSERWVATPLRGGALVQFDVRRISAITGQLTVRLGDRQERPANGELSAIVNGELRTSPITDQGRFFLERMPPGKHVVQAIWGGGSCRAAITLPAGAPPVFDAGEVRCIPDVLEPGGRLPKITDPGYASGAFPPDPEKGAGAGGP